MDNRRGFTLIELLVVITIILAVSAIALPSVLSGINSRQADGAALILQGALVGARDAAIHDNAVSGIRLIHDPALPGALSLIVQTRTPSRYTLGMCSIYPAQNYAALTPMPCLVLEESPGNWQRNGGKWFFEVNEPTSWWWNLRLGERVTIASQTYTICGPAFQSTSEGVTNVNPAIQPYTRTFTAPDGTTVGPLPVQYLFLVNSKDDNLDGFIDNGWDGIDNDFDGIVDNLPEWEAESWNLAAINTVNLAYRCTRRPVSISQPVSLGSTLIDVARSRLPVNALTGDVDLIIDQTGHVTPSLLYGVPTSLTMDSSFFHFWLGDRGDVGLAGIPKNPARLLTVFARTGKTSVMADPTDIVDAKGNITTPYQQAQQGQ